METTSSPGPQGALLEMVRNLITVFKHKNCLKAVISSLLINGCREAASSGFAGGDWTRGGHGSEEWEKMTGWGSWSLRPTQHPKLR